MSENSKNPTAKTILKEKEQSWKAHAPWLQTTTNLQSSKQYRAAKITECHKNNRGPSKQYRTGTKHTHRPIKQSREPRNKPIHLKSINL